MSSENRFEFTKDNIDTYLKELAKEYRKLVGKNMPAEIILIGGASVLVNYGFRDMTTDIDALIQAASSMKDATACCSQGIQFFPAADLVYPDDFPENGVTVTVCGTFAKNDENAYMCSLVDAEMEIAAVD